MPNRPPSQPVGERECVTELPDGSSFLSRIKAEEKRAQARKRNESRETVSVAGDADRVWDVSGAKEN